MYKMDGRGNMLNKVKSESSRLGIRLDDWEDYVDDFI